MGMLEYLHSGKELKEMPVGSSISGKSLDGRTYTPLICAGLCPDFLGKSVQMAVTPNRERCYYFKCVDSGISDGRVLLDGDCVIGVYNRENIKYKNLFKFIDKILFISL